MQFAEFDGRLDGFTMLAPILSFTLPITNKPHTTSRVFAYATQLRHIGKSTSCTSKLNLLVYLPVEKIQRRRKFSPLEFQMCDDGLQKKNKVPLYTTVFHLYRQMATWATLLYPVWTLAAAIFALLRPSLFSGISSQSISWALSLLMFSVGSTLSLKDFLPVLKSPFPVLLGLIGCYVLMPLLSVLISSLCRFHYELYAGMILLGCVSGGQASNLSTYIAKGDVALSVAMTTISTLASVFMLPALSKLFLGTIIPINALELSKSTAEVVIAPIFLGMLLHSLFPTVMYHLEPVLPLIGVFATMYCVVGALSKVQSLILTNLGSLFLPVMLLHFVGGKDSWNSWNNLFIAHVERSCWILCPKVVGLE